MNRLSLIRSSLAKEWDILWLFMTKILDKNSICLLFTISNAKSLPWTPCRLFQYHIHSITCQRLNYSLAGMLSVNGLCADVCVWNRAAHRGVSVALSSMSNISLSMTRCLLCHRRDNLPRLITRFRDNDDDELEVIDVELLLLLTGVDALAHSINSRSLSTALSVILTETAKMAKKQQQSGKFVSATLLIFTACMIDLMVTALTVT